MGLIENGFSKGDKILLWVDQDHSAEVLAAQLGAAKAGVQVIVLSEKDSADAFSSALKDSGASGLIVSPGTHVSETETRGCILNKVIPELATKNPGDDLSIKAFPNLKRIVQTGHSKIRGTLKYKDAMSYVSPSMSKFSLPENSPTDSVIEVYKNGRSAHSFSNQEICQHAESLWTDHFSTAKFDSPIFMACDLESPLGLACFLGVSAHFHKAVIPSSMNMSRILKCLRAQHSTHLVCDQAFFEAAPQRNLQQHIEEASSVTDILVGGSAGKSTLFGGASAKSVDPYSLQ